MTPRQRRLALLLLLVGAAWPPTWAGDGIQLQVGRGAGPQEVTLSWTGNQPTFEVYRGGQAATVADPANKLGETVARAWSDLPPARWPTT